MLQRDGTDWLLITMTNEDTDKSYDNNSDVWTKQAMSGVALKCLHEVLG